MRKDHGEKKKMTGHAWDVQNSSSRTQRTNERDIASAYGKPLVGPYRCIDVEQQEACDFGGNILFKHNSTPHLLCGGRIHVLTTLREIIPPVYI